MYNNETLNKYFFRVEFDGKNYSGWQEQPNAVTVQGIVNDAFKKVTRQSLSVVGAGRTDAGVHARGMGAHIELSGNIDINRIQYSVNGVLPRDISIRDFQKVESSFHARFSAVERVYKYRITMRKSPLWRHQAWFLNRRIDWNLIEKNMEDLIGNHNFTTFCAAKSESKSMDCNVNKVSLEKQNEIFIITISANRFLYRMVRSIVGTLVDIGSGVISDSMHNILLCHNRDMVGVTAPACGLVLEDVFYNEVV